MANTTQYTDTEPMDAEHLQQLKASKKRKAMDDGSGRVNGKRFRLAAPSVIDPADAKPGATKAKNKKKKRKSNGQEAEICDPFMAELEAEFFRSIEESIAGRNEVEVDEDTQPEQTQRSPAAEDDLSGAERTDYYHDIRNIWAQTPAALLPREYHPRPTTTLREFLDDEEYMDMTPLWPKDILRELWIFAKNTLRKKEVRGFGLGSLEVAAQCVACVVLQAERRARRENGDEEEELLLGRRITAGDVAEARVRWCEEQGVKYNA